MSPVCSRLALSTVCLAALACSGDKADDSGTKGPACSSTAAPGTGAAVVDGERIEWADVAWTDTGSGLQITTGTTADFRITLVANNVAEAVLSGSPVTVSLDGTAGFGLIYSGSESHSSEEGAGSLSLLPPSDDALDACFWFTSDGPEVSGGELSALPLAR